MQQGEGQAYAIGPLLTNLRCEAYQSIAQRTKHNYHSGCVFFVSYVGPVHMKEIASFSHRGMISALAWSTDGLQLLSASFDGAIKVWRDSKVITLREPRESADDTHPMEDAVWSADWSASRGGWVTSERDGIVLYDAVKGPSVIWSRLSASKLKCSPTSSFVALQEAVSSSDKQQMEPRLRIRDLDRPSDPPSLDIELRDHYTDIAWSPNGHVLALMTRMDLTLWPPSSRIRDPRPVTIGPWANEIAWLGNDELAVGYGDSNIRIFDRKSIRRIIDVGIDKIGILEAHQESITSVSAGIGGDHLATADFNGCVHVWGKSRRSVFQTTIDKTDGHALKVLLNPVFPILAYARSGKVGLIAVESSQEPKQAVEPIEPPTRLDVILNAAELGKDRLLDSDEVRSRWSRILPSRGDNSKLVHIVTEARRTAIASQNLSGLLHDALRQLWAVPTRQDIIDLEDLELATSLEDQRSLTKTKLVQLVLKATASENGRTRTIAVCACTILLLNDPDVLALEDLTKSINTLEDEKFRLELKRLLTSEPKSYEKVAERLEQAISAISGALLETEPLVLGGGSGTKEKFALIMKGGGLKGLACVGALKELQRFYEFDLYVGTSAGAIIAAFLGAGYTADEMETILRDMNFKTFLPERFKRITNLIFHGGFYRGTQLKRWVEQKLADKLELDVDEPQFLDLPNHVRIYACRRDTDALVFDSKNNPKDYVAHAVRCSIAIPFFFIPERDNGLHVFDGGMRHNYPVKKLLEQNPDKKFIGLYLRDKPSDTESVLSSLINISFEATDREALRTYKDETVVIDPLPVSTLDFSLSAEEKTFLISQGRIAALRFLRRKGLVDKSEEDAAIKRGEEFRAAALIARRKRTFWTRMMKWAAVASLVLVLTWAAGEWLGFWRFAAANADRVYSSVCGTVAICAGTGKSKQPGPVNPLASRSSTADQPVQCQEKFDAVTAAGSIKFDLGSANLSSQSYPMMRSVAQIAQDCGDAIIEVQGHTDPAGADNFNMNLSQLRAEAVVRFLVEAGVSSDRLRGVGYGASRPLVPNDTMEGRAKNRRIQFEVSEATKGK